eukprot:TRINITY_DN27481_c0_g1_i1.p1 TRINITY_DN27481_c0_g1~~TRINITY_DN27481_c0_g1_i1.p1  ORF type:complete len:402 (+),score=75.20 TRINITY_DN27481_c0_g1_i1:2-1207(+)
MAASEQSRAVTAFEGLFLCSNVRFVNVLEYAEAVSAAAAKARLEHVMQSSLPFWLDAEASNNNRFNLSIRSRPSSIDSMHIDSGKDMGTLADDLAAQDEDISPIKVIMLLTSDNLCKGLAVNANHAMVDGMSMVNFWQRLTSDHEMHSQQPSLPPCFHHCLPESSSHTPFLPLPSNTLGLKAILGGQGDEKPRHLRIKIPAAIFEAARAAAKASGVKATALIAAVLHLALADVYLADHRDVDTCATSVSILVDMRKFMHEEGEDDFGDYQLAIGTVTVGATVQRADLASPDGLLRVAKRAQKELTDRLANNEHIAQALALSQGRFDEGAPSATVELSNLGRIAPDTSHRLHLAQRFDGFDGISILTHSQNEGLVLTMSIGAGLNSSKADHFADKVGSLLRI